MRIFLTFIFINTLFSQARVGEWDIFTSPLEIADLVELDSLLVCATNGGILVYDRDLNAFDTYTKLDGLLNTHLAVITVDPYNQIWVGGSSPNGFIQILDESFSVRKTFDMDLTEIADFAITDSIAFGAFLQNQDWGIMEFRFDDEQYFYKDVYNNWPVTLNRITGIVLDGEKLYVGTDQGLFIGDWKNSNLKDPANWVQHSALTGNITVFRRHNDVILIIMDKDIYTFDLESTDVELKWDYYHDSYLLNDIVLDEEGGLWGIRKRIFIKIKMNPSGTSWTKRPGETLKRIFTLLDGSIVVGTTTGLLFVDTDNHSFIRQKPNAMATNEVSAIHVLSDGRVVAGSRKGLMIKEVEGWRNIVGINGDALIIHENRDYSRFVADTIPVHFGDYYIADIEEGPDGLLYCGIRGTWPEPRVHGGGILVIDIDDPANFTLIDTSHLDYFEDEYMIVKDIAKDPFGNLWIADTYATTNFEPIKVLKTDGTWGAFSVQESGNTLSLTPNSIDFDSWGRVWIGSFEDNNNVGGAKDGGVTMLDYTGDPANPAKTEWTNVSVNTDASTNTVWSLGINSNDILYLLTPKGLIGLTLQFSNIDPVQQYGFTYYPNISFGIGSKLRIDPRDNVWACSPSDGVFVLTSSATFWPDINGITEKNSFLLSNSVSSVAFDRNEGLAYIATNKGINVLKIPFAEKNRTFSSVGVFPSPFRVPSDVPLTIDGLMDNSSCKIMTLTGRVLKTIKSRPEVEGYQAFWDGRDESGQWVGTGVYLIAVYDENGASSFLKIAVIHQ
ncbi:MAG: hypothetical protein IIB45_07380 [Candidatus Marinimicrobia bacterium]|nr:hypothetical protein [Candidatus Neomarinimicrobiota bacterium]